MNRLRINYEDYNEDKYDRIFNFLTVTVVVVVVVVNIFVEYSIETVILKNKIDFWYSYEIIVCHSG